MEKSSYVTDWFYWASQDLDVGLIFLTPYVTSCTRGSFLLQSYWTSCCTYQWCIFILHVLDWSKTTIDNILLITLTRESLIIGLKRWNMFFFLSTLDSMLPRDPCSKKSEKDKKNNQESGESTTHIIELLGVFSRKNLFFCRPREHVYWYYNTLGLPWETALYLWDRDYR